VTTTTARAMSLALGEAAPRPAAPPEPGFEISFDVRGKPVPQGSLVRSPTGGMYHAKRPELLNWRLRIAEAAEVAMAGLPPLDGPVEVVLAFRFARPNAHFLPANRSRPEPVLRPDAPYFHITVPDADKVGRAGLDALSSVAFGDDAQVAELRVTKRYVYVAEGPGVHGSVRSLEAAAQTSEVEPEAPDDPYLWESGT
jgi:crossover junction endodeoxyribonuclease RusA